MDARNLYYPSCEVNLAKTDANNPDVICDKGIIYVKTVFPSGKTDYIKASNLKTKKEADEKQFQQIMWALQDAIHTLGLSKAEVSRRLRSYQVIGK